MLRKENEMLLATKLEDQPGKAAGHRGRGGGIRAGIRA